MTLAVVYLARRTNPPRFLRRFLSSLARHPAGALYDLVVIAKGWTQSPPDLAGFSARGLRRIETFLRSDDSFATPLFAEMGNALDHERIAFFVSWSQILAPGWARIMGDALDAEPRCGVVGASAGWEALDASTPFPNPSIRTTGFMIRRGLWAELDFGEQSTKRAGNMFEAGPRSMTRQIEARGMIPLLAGRDGGLWPPEAWPRSGGFRLGDQRNLLIADNRTQDYATASLRRRRKLSQLNWGDPDLAAPASPVVRLGRRLAWRFGR